MEKALEKALGYVMGDLNTFKDDVNILKHDMGVAVNKFKRQNKINRGFVLLAILGGLYICKKERLQEEEIKSLTKKVEELKKLKGE